jgi:hypothetical protein
MRIITSNSAPGKGRTPPRNPRDRAALAAIERAFTRVIPLTCGHITYLEIDLQYANWRPRRKVKGRLVTVSYCETCGDYIQVEPPYKSPPIPDEPLF